MNQLDEFIEKDDEQTDGEPRKNTLSARAKVMLVTDKAVFGPGPVRLLRLIDETNSVSEACSNMNLSYSKGWQLLNQMEEGLGFRVIKRYHGGAGGGKSELSDKGRYLMDKYEELNLKTQNILEQLFDELFYDLDKLKEE